MAYLNNNLKKSCAGCPFRKDTLEGWLGERAKEISDAILNDGNFVCHKTMNLEESKREWCHGAKTLIHKEINIKGNLYLRLQAMKGDFDPNLFVPDDDCFNSQTDFINHHKY